MINKDDLAFIVIGDVHGRKFWKDAIGYENEVPVIFLGDYLDPYVDEGITQEEAFDHPQKNLLTRGIGLIKNMNGDVFVVDVNTDDTILLCSDGLTDMLHDKEIAEHLQKEDTEAAADALLSGSLEKGGRDNISFIILKLDRKEVEHDGR